MKRLLQSLILILVTSAAFAQQPCQSAFTYYDNNQGYIYFYDASYNIDSTPITVTAWNWTVTGGGATYTFTTQNPILQTNGYNGPFYVCLTIASNLGCSSTICDTINTNPIGGACNADYTYQNANYNYTFTDLSTAGSFFAVVNSWNWVIYDNLQNTLFTSTQQNPSFVFPGNGVYTVCLSINTTDTCSDTYCNSITVIDTNQQNNCQISVTNVISNVTIIGGNDGSIDLTVTGGTPPYHFFWNTGATTEDIYGLTSGVYTVSIGQSDSLCPNYSYTFQIIEPYDTTVIDTLWINPIDTCLNFFVDTFYISNVFVQGNYVTVTWTFQGGGQIGTFTVTYSFGNYGVYVITLSLNCAKTMTTYYTYINIASQLGIAENAAKELLVYPNPTTGAFRIDVPGSSGNTVQIFNSMGQMVYSGKTSMSSTTVDASQWPAGIYMIRLLDGNGQMITRNVVKQ